jgi:hypothetical protein
LNPEQETGNTRYIPGVCNIGLREINRRRNGAFFSGAVTAAEILLLSIIPVSHLWRLTLFIPATSFAIGILQWYLKFCVGFGTKGVFNFGELGNTTRIEQKESLRKDLIKSREMTLAGIVFGFISTLLFYLF